MTAHRLVLLTIFAFIQGCGGGGGGGGGNSGPGPGPPPTPTAPGSFSASLRFDGATQRFVATWNVSQGVDRYRVLLKRDTVADFAPLAGADNLSSTILDFNFAVGFTVQWSAAALRVEACNSVGCTAATDVPLLPHLAEALATKKILQAPVDASQLNVASSADGNTLVIGAPFDDGEDGLQFNRGVVYVYTRSGTTWNEQPQVLRAANGEGGLNPLFSSGDHFGEAVALSDDAGTLVVTALLEDGSRTSTIENENNDADAAGAVYVFVRNATTYELEAYLKPTPGALDTGIAGDAFGHAVALAADGRTLVVGAPFAEAGFRPREFNDGAAYVFTRGDAGWTQRAILGGPHADANATDEFGLQVAISADGSTVAAGSPADDDGVDNSGAAYVFTTIDRLQWTREAVLKAPNAGDGDIFGFAVALSADGNTLAVGARNEDGDATSTLDDDNDNIRDAGAVYVYMREASQWSAAPVYLKPSNTIEQGEFGTNLRLTASGNELAISAPFDRSAPPLEGAVFIFVRVGNSWIEQARFDGTESQFGVSIAFTADGATLFIAGHTAQVPPVAGAVHVH
jgi:hypothetical protein